MIGNFLLALFNNEAAKIPLTLESSNRICQYKVTNDDIIKFIIYNIPKFFKTIEPINRT